MGPLTRLMRFSHMRPNISSNSNSLSLQLCFAWNSFISKAENVSAFLFAGHESYFGKEGPATVTTNRFSRTFDGHLPALRYLAARSFATRVEMVLPWLETLLAWIELEVWVRFFVRSLVPPIP